LDAIMNAKRIRAHCGLLVVATVLSCTAMLGCGQGKTPRKSVQGSVTCGGAAVPQGTVRLAAADGATPVRVAQIVDGKYRFDSADGVSLGKYSVQVDARRKTGRKVKGTNGIDVTLVDEVVQMGPIAYSGAGSPLVLEVSSDFSGTFDIAIPKQ
jgi:hypothetical protein